ncbi:MAG: IS630 family transposase [Thermoleophilaceae bacterium]
MAIKALACELPARHGVPLARWHTPELARAAVEQGIVAAISDTTIWRWLSGDAIRPWQHRSWIFPRDPDLSAKAARVLDLYARRFNGRKLGGSDYVLSADEKTSIQARARKHDTLPPAPKRPTRVEHEYERRGALAYLAAWDVGRAKVFGRCELTSGIEPFDRLVDQVMASEPYASARRVFWVVDNGSSHRGQASIDRLQSKWRTLRLVHLSIHASWLNQVEIYFSVIQRKVLTPNDFSDLGEVEARLLAFQDHYAQIATPFEWKFTTADLHALLARTVQHETKVSQAA